MLGTLIQRLIWFRKVGGGQCMGGREGVREGGGNSLSDYELGARGDQSFGLPSKEDDTDRMGQGHRLPSVWVEGSI